jgi:hypothetical protein
MGVTVDIGNFELLFEFAANFVHSRVHLIKKGHTAAAREGSRELLLLLLLGRGEGLARYRWWGLIVKVRLVGLGYVLSERNEVISTGVMTIGID